MGYCCSRKFWFRTLKRIRFFLPVFNRWLFATVLTQQLRKYTYWSTCIASPWAGTRRNSVVFLRHVEHASQRMKSLCLPRVLDLLAGQNFQNSATLSCRFGSATFTVLARYLTPHTLECIAPAQSVGDVSVKLSINGQQYSDVNAIYSYYDAPESAAIYPQRGPSAGGTVVTVYFSNGVPHILCLSCILMWS